MVQSPEKPRIKIPLPAEMAREREKPGAYLRV